jgi:hypothetical protein
MKKMSNVEIKRGNTAISRQKMSRPMKKMYESGKFDNKRVLDYGCGKGFDVEYLKERKIDIQGYEPFASDKYLQLPEGKFDIITNNYVLNVIENTKIAKMYLNNEFEVMSEDEFIDTSISQLLHLKDDVIIHRIGADSKVEDLIAPTWVSKKMSLIDKIDVLMDQNDLYQGEYY